MRTDRFKSSIRWAMGLAVWATTVAACSDGDEPIPMAEGVFAPLGAVRPDASEAQREAFERGLQVALRRFGPSDGLGPSFNTVFCGGCHEKPVTGGSAPRYRNFLLTGQRLPDGVFVETGRNGVQVMYEPSVAVRPPTDAATNVVATRSPIPFFGTGLLAELPDASILVNADPVDEDGDGISGRPNYDRGFVGRFGRKAQTVSIEGFIRGPLFNHMGITSNPLPEARKDALPVPSASARSTGSIIGRTGRGQAAAPDEPTEDDDGVADPELSEQDLFDLVSYAMLLAAPEPEPSTPTTASGEQRFAQVGCDGCHVPTLVGPRGRIPLYSDLLLHDMGPELADGIEMKLASGAEFRTQPLWGIAATGPYLHDGRADTLHEAIVWHGGEATASKEAYAALSASEQDELQAFLRSLGGRNQASAGLLPPDAAVPAAGEWGAPTPGLDDDGMARFRAGRSTFDRDVPLSEGLGPLLNGDSCRACHFEPTVGGAGPSGVNVIRHGIVAGDGAFTAAPEGTIAHRLAVEQRTRPPVSPGVNLYELRQTPALFGLARLAAIPEAAVLANEDPDDTDGDGVRGIAHRLPDGRLGRFGWRADVPSLLEFARDALGAEMGMTVPDQDGLTYGATTDADDSPDPEIDEGTLMDLVFYLEALAPPPRAPAAEAEVRGRVTFDAIGCAVCHRPEMPAGPGEVVAAYTDLLLHDVQAEGYVGVPSFAASGRQFRTAPLWGLRGTAPYWHDGRADTIEAAIAVHEGEASAARQSYEALSGPDRADVIAFLESL